MLHTPRGLVAGQVCLPPEVELSTCPGCLEFAVEHAAVAACFVVEYVHGSAAELVHADE